MAKELAFALINPYTVAKSRTGAVISRIMTRTGLELVAARMYAPGAEFVGKYADLLRNDTSIDEEERPMLAEYVSNAYAPDAKSGKPRRVMMLIFEGEDAVGKVRDAVGHVNVEASTGQTVRQTFGDLILNDDGNVQYFEPAIIISRSKEGVGAALKLWSSDAESHGGFVDGAADVPEGASIQKTLVLIKPDNFRFPSARPGNIIDIFSASGLRIIAAKVHRMSVAQAEEFYGPVRDFLREKLKDVAASKAADAVSAALGFDIKDEMKTQLGDLIGPTFGDAQFFEIVKFMTGDSPEDVAEADKPNPGKEKCLALVYVGEDAVNSIRDILGPTDPSKAQPGSVRREFGTDIMVNAAHASDSPENAQREMGIVKVEEDLVSEWTGKYYP